MELQKIQKLTKDIKQSAVLLDKAEARYLVDTYYQFQNYRIAAAAQVRATDESGEPNGVIEYVFQELKVMENEIKKALKAYAENDRTGEWAMSITGIGPVIAAGLLAHIDIEKAPTAGHIWNFAGINPNMSWGKGEKRPWNAKLKVLCWKIGQSFVKVSNNDNDVYGHIYKERKEYESAKNEAGEYAGQAENKLATTKIGKDTEAYKWYSQGKLPPGHIQQRAERYATKIFLSHLHEVMYINHYHEKPPKPFAIEHLGHAHKIDVPNFDKS